MLFTYKELIDLAIGTPESGHVNFYALQVLLTCFAQRLEILDKVVEVQNSFLLGQGSEFRLFAGADAEGEAPEQPANEAPGEEAPAEVPPAEVAPAEEAPTEEAPGEEAPGEEAPGEEAPGEEASGEEAPVKALVEDIVELPAEESAPDFTKESTEPKPEALEFKETQEAEPGPDGQLPAVHSSFLSVRSMQRKISLDPAMMATVVRLEKRLSTLERHNEQAFMDMEQFVSQFKVQIMLTMEQVNNVAHILIDRKQDPHRIKIVRIFAKQLKALIETGSGRELSVSWSSDEAGLEGYEEALTEDDFEEEEDMARRVISISEQSLSLKEMPLSLERLDNDVVALKSQLCALTNNVNDLATLMMKHDNEVLLEKFRELQNEIADLNVFKSSTKEAISHIMELLHVSTKKIDNLQSSALLLDERKSDRLEVELLMAEKVNFEQLATKVSLEQLQNFEFKLDKTSCEIRGIISENERNVLRIMDNLRMTLGIDAMEVGLKEFREMVEKRVGVVSDALQRYMEMTNDECAAAAGRVKVMQDLACLSCDTTCLMRTVERQKLPSLPKARGSVGMAPAITYDVGTIRGTGLMGYYRKDEFPCSPHAWTKGTSRVPLDKCNPRHAGGIHTIHTAEEHMQKVVLSKRTSGWM